MLLGGNGDDELEGDKEMILNGGYDDDRLTGGPDPIYF